MSDQKAVGLIGRGLRAKGQKDNYPTPKKLYDEWNEEFHFDHDPCPINPEGLRSADGLGSEWGKRNYVNPPYSNKLPWIKKAVEEQRKGRMTVMLLPVDTSTSWFLDYVLPNAQIRWLRGRISFNGRTHAAYASMLAIFLPILDATTPEGTLEAKDGTTQISARVVPPTTPAQGGGEP